MQPPTMVEEGPEKPHVDLGNGFEVKLGLEEIHYPKAVQQF